jgi:hypothetical protein
VDASSRKRAGPGRDAHVARGLVKLSSDMEVLRVPPDVRHAATNSPHHHKRNSMFHPARGSRRSRSRLAASTINSWSLSSGRPVRRRDHRNASTWARYEAVRLLKTLRANHARMPTSVPPMEAQVRGHACSASAWTICAVDTEDLPKDLNHSLVVDSSRKLSSLPKRFVRM